MIPGDLVRPHGPGTAIAVRVVPGSSAAKVMGLHGGELRVRVCSPPVDGRANDEVMGLLAAVLGVRTRDIEVLSGRSARSKVLFVDLSPALVSDRLLPWIGPSGAPQR